MEADRLEMERLEAERIEIEHQEQELRERDAAEAAEPVASGEPSAGNAAAATEAAASGDSPGALQVADTTGSDDAHDTPGAATATISHDAPDAAGEAIGSAAMVASRDAPAAEAVPVDASPLDATASSGHPATAAGVAVGGSEPRPSGAATGFAISEPKTTSPDRPTAANADADAGFSLPRTAMRAAFGSLAGLSMAWVLAWLIEPSAFEGASTRELVGGFVNEAILTVLTITAAVTFAEGALRALRIPGGSIYRRLGRSRWVASAIEGFVAGGSVGWLTSVAYYLSKGDDRQVTLESLLVHAVFTATGFVLAEALVHAFGRSRGRA
jgi:hypothetical protein